MMKNIAYNHLIKKIFAIVFIPMQAQLSAQNYDAELVSQKTNIIINNNNSMVKTFFYELKINNRAGEKYTKIVIPYSKMNKVSKIYAYLKDNTGTDIRELKKSEISERSLISNSSFYEDNYIKEFILRHNSYPYTIVFTYQLQQEEFLYIDYWLPVFDSEIPTREASLSLKIPKSYRCSYNNRLINELIIDTTETQIIYTWKASYLDVVKPEKLSPPLNLFMPYVVIVPQDFKYEFDGSFKSWIDYGNWQFEIMSGIGELPVDEKIKVFSLLEGVEDKKEKIKLLYDYLQDETRYINITIETGGLKPYPASYVAENKYGDCKALTNYFKSLLDLIGIKSYYTNIYAGNPIKEVNKSFPSQQFNHVILCIPFKRDTIWLDCTSDCAFNYLGTFTQNRDALVIENNNSHFVHTPALSYKDVIETRNMVITCNQQLGTKARFLNVYKGAMYESLLNLKNSFSLSEKSQILRGRIVDDGFELIDYNIYQIHRDSLEIYLSYTANSTKIYNIYGNEVLVKNIPFSIPQFEEPENRKLPVQIDYPIYKIDTIVYEIPHGLKLSTDLNNRSVSDKYGQYIIQFLEKDKTIMVVKSLLINSGYYPVIEYRNLYKFFNEINDTENKTYITFTK
jgi:hypothetical protein